MRISIVLGASALALAMFGCASGASHDGSKSDDVTTSALGEVGVVTCTPDGGKVQLAVVAGKDGKGSLVTLTPAGAFFALDGASGTLSTANGIGWKGAKSSLALGADLKGTWTSGATTTNVACAKASASQGASWQAASGLVAYEGDIDGLAETVLTGGENNAPSVKVPTYTVFALATAQLDASGLPVATKKTTGELPGEDGESLLDENDWSYGGISAAYGLGGGEDYGEWFQGASDGISLASDLGATPAKFAAHEKVTALSALVDSTAPSAISVTVGDWTFLVPDAFAK